MHILLELAVLLNLINPGKLLESRSSPSDDGSRLQMSPWHRFLDEFAWLGDTRKGGESVTAVAGLVTSGRPMLLFANNHGVKPSVHAHLRLVLELLQSLTASDIENRSKIQRQILETSVRASHDKVQNYSIRLMKAAAHATTYSTMLTLEVDAPLRLVLADMKNLTKDHLTLCDWAYDFTKSGNLIFLDQKCNIRPKVPAFHRVRHYIGRLGAWHRASRILTKIAFESPELIAGLTLEVIPSRPLLCRSPQVDRNALQHLIADLRLELDAELVLKKLQALYDTARGSDEEKPINIEIAFWERLLDPTMKPMVHAEVLIAEYIFDSNLCFLRDDSSSLKEKRRDRGGGAHYTASGAVTKEAEG
ncbi:hypothetical protein PMZ80_011134 [Knufia obscura]|uniref:Uncharacterized protein n=1 Tax=Knufia obscura TaxID=1635080 RepID=A0ABR0R7T0_9EURO|nr:hypothetical protein PMZ80_011134 [Knufia obscura]